MLGLHSMGEAGGTRSNAWKNWGSPSRQTYATMCPNKKVTERLTCPLNRKRKGVKETQLPGQKEKIQGKCPTGRGGAGSARNPKKKKREIMIKKNPHTRDSPKKWV